MLDESYIVKSDLLDLLTLVRLVAAFKTKLIRVQSFLTPTLGVKLKLEQRLSLLSISTALVMS